MGRRPRSGLGDAPEIWSRTFPNGSLPRRRSLLKEVHELGLTDDGADAEVDIVEADTPLCEFYRLSIAAIEPAAIRAGVLTPEQATAMNGALAEPRFLGCGFVHIGVWGRRPPT